MGRIPAHGPPAGVNLTPLPGVGWKGAATLLAIASIYFVFP